VASPAVVKPHLHGIHTPRATELRLAEHLHKLGLRILQIGPVNTVGCARS
jgi:hypothetical protein